MKIFVRILMFYFLLLMVVPCCTMDICHDDDAAVSINDSHKDEDDCNNCSPFAVCGQCTGFSFMVPSIMLAPPQKMIEQKFATSLGIYNSPLLFPLFQPPRA